MRRIASSLGVWSSSEVRSTRELSLRDRKTFVPTSRTTRRRYPARTLWVGVHLKAHSEKPARTKAVPTFSLNRAGG